MIGKSTKERNKNIHNMAVHFVAGAVGINAYNELSEANKKRMRRHLAGLFELVMKNRERINTATAKRHIERAIRRLRNEPAAVVNWGGARSRKVEEGGRGDND